jgi:hypothetical protein
MNEPIFRALRGKQHSCFLSVFKAFGPRAKIGLDFHWNYSYIFP